jgi:ATP-dependent exoDNAse (exonuclease V) beta subunit
LGKIAAASGLDGTPIPYNSEGADAARLELRVGQTPIACTIYEPGRRWEYHPPRPGVASAPQAPVPPPLLAPVPTGEEQLDRRTVEQERVSPQRVWRVVPDVERVRAPAWVIGSLVHEALAAWSFPDSGPAASAPHSFERWAEARARAYGLTDRRQLEDAMRHSRRLLLRFRAHPLYQEMDVAERRLHEVPYSLVVDGRIESGIIDALYLRSASWTIVEFKTDRVTERARFEELLAEEDYLAQTRRYLAAAERLLDQRPRCILCMLNYAGAVHLEMDLVV